ncbi:hypothetical protein E2C01_041711 [Portunus trituberculatus]|uniref:Uncharacterized protein n=1 Tax=Portunus trituberculatus TaxID=210409 RepID=A0A5B7FKL8_PORTR|nr:hypothetical protein [Portunus trituberculatus]
MGRPTADGGRGGKTGRPTHSQSPACRTQEKNSGTAWTTRRQAAHTEQYIHRSGVATLLDMAVLTPGQDYPMHAARDECLAVSLRIR